MNIVHSARNRVRNLVNQDRFSWLNRDRASHLRLREFLAMKYPPDADVLTLGNYTFPRRLLKTVRDNPVVISGGVEFHIDFELDLSRAVPLQCHFFEVDHASMAWFRENYGTREDFRINHLGLSSAVECLEVLGDPKRSWSSTVDKALAASSGRAWGVIGTVETTTVGRYCRQQGIAAIGLMKLDIEGYAVRVIHSTWDDGIFPSIIVFEVERGATENIFDYSERLFALLDRAKELDYVVWHVPRLDGYSSFSTDFILVKAQELQPE
jgi:hypothetical protein